VILASIVPGVLVFVLAVWAVKDGGGGGAESVKNGGRDRGDAPTVSASDRSSASSSLLPIGFFYLLRMPETLLILRVQQIGVPVAAVPLLWAAVHVAKSSASFAGGSLSDRLGPVRTMWLGWAAYAAIAAGFALAIGTAMAWVLFLAFGIVAGLTESPERALVAASAGARQGSGFGNYHAITGIAALGGGLALGAIYQHAGAGPAFWASAGAGLALCALAARPAMRARGG
jgi:predicted MFS family arabinose efflux permease